ncbi:pseudouridine synthase [Cecembia sp.]|uniref:pseudouridine synthase n=1 Tax=Cecembia sp. TaxID=1898110 RepID=UPI0025BB1533|nr:pseudouridine synthase [Cecembia sp.]
MVTLLEIIYEDEYYIAINKPAGVLVHRTNLAKEEYELLAVQMLREQIGQKVYPLHRIDRPTSGVLIFGKNSEATSLLQPLFPTAEVKKFYLCLVRGYIAEHGLIEQPLKKKLYGELQEAMTEFCRIDQVEIPYASSSRYPSSRYALIKVYPHTGRMHQIRRHMAHARHYIIGDSTHGDNKQNIFFRTTFGLKNLLLHAWQVEFTHPFTKNKVRLEADIPSYFLEIVEKLSLQLPNSD